MTLSTNPINDLQGNLKLSELERFIELSRLVGFRQFSLKDIRDRQDAELTEKLRQQALARIGDPQQIEVSDDSYFIGSVDYMVRRKADGRLGYTVLETNGGSSRGYTLLSAPDAERLMSAFVEMVRYVDADEPLLFLIGHPDGDLVITEKFLAAFRLKEALEKERPGQNVRILSIDEFSKQPRGDESVIVISPHSRTVLGLQLRDDKVYLLGQRVHLIIGDGAIARHHELSRRRADVVLANWIHPVTGDKYATYAAIELARDSLIAHGMYPLLFWRAGDKDELMAICEKQRSEVEGLIIKPFRGSGGVGVIPIVLHSSVPDAVENSLGEFYTKYGRRFSPFPYTICEKINPRKASWLGERHNFDIRIYVARQGDSLIPVGCLFRVAPLPDRGKYSKGSLIVNLSGYGGIATERGLGLSQQSLEIVHLEEEDIVNIFAASTLLMAAISKQPVDWAKYDQQPTTSD